MAKSRRKKRPRVNVLGTLRVDTGDVVCFSSDSVQQILCALGKDGRDLKDYNEFLNQFGGVRCQFAADGSYPVEKVIAVDRRGQSSDVVVIGGGMRSFQRMLLNDEPTFSEFYERHPLREQVGQGAAFRPRLFARIAREYRQKLSEKSSRR